MLKYSSSTTTQDGTSLSPEQVMQQARHAVQHIQVYSIKQRITEVKRVIEYIRINRESITDELTQATGKTRTDALVSEILGVLDNLHWNCSNANRILAEKKVHTPVTLLGKSSRIRHEPYGVILLIVPWNYPLHISLTFAIGAFLAGNSVIIKPSEHTPMPGLLERIFAAAPLLASCIHVMYGDGVIGQELIDARPDKIFFTGSTVTGKKILRHASELLIPVDVELGGKDPMIVFEDVNLQRTVAGALWGAMTNAGQSCTSVELLYIQRAIFNPFITQFKQAMEQLVINTGDQGNADVGAITTSFQAEIIQEHLDDAKRKGAMLFSVGQAISSTSRLIPPTLITDVNEDMLIMQEETFGPVVCAIPFDSEDEIIRLVNQSSYGLSASVWSKDLKRAKRVSHALQTGAVSINNVMLTEGNPALPFGGVKESGFGRGKGEEGLLAFTRSKAIIIDKQSGKKEPNWYPYTLKKYQLFGELIDALFSKGWLKYIKLALVGGKLEKTSQQNRGD
ncbi:aldehyde dehydrogenase family protein [Zooshikella sp. RANM57]|uniref:aldehyde dehydrogenase family protein n=1 Tax=Zooshikella sp. RANM57 TaxID=3425863 RepID=UPI003D6E8A89